MEAKRFLLAPVVALIACSAFAAEAGLSRQEVQSELTRHYEIRQVLEQNKGEATRYGCDFSAISFDINAQIKCNELIERIVSFDGANAAAKVAAFEKAQGSN